MYIHERDNWTNFRWDASEVSLLQEYLKAIFKGKKPVSERLLKLDAERFKKGDLPLSNLLSKYCSYIAQSN